jgi:hypothetical protein
VVNRCWLCESDDGVNGSSPSSLRSGVSLVERHFQPFWFVLGYA